MAQSYSYRIQQRVIQSKQIRRSTPRICRTYQTSHPGTVLALVGGFANILERDKISPLGSVRKWPTPDKRYEASWRHLRRVRLLSLGAVLAAAQLLGGRVETRV